MTEKIIFVYKLFLSLSILDFIFCCCCCCCCCCCKIATPHEKSYPPLFQQLLSKLKSSQAPLFENLAGGSTLSAERGEGVHTMSMWCGNFCSYPNEVPLQHFFNISWTIRATSFIFHICVERRLNNTNMWFFRVALVKCD